MLSINVLENINILPFSLKSAKIAAEVEGYLREKGVEINLIHVLIASVAIEHSLITRAVELHNI